VGQVGTGLGNHLTDGVRKKVTFLNWGGKIIYLGGWFVRPERAETQGRELLKCAFS